MNQSGIKPIEYNVLIDQDEVEAKTSGGLWKPEELQDQEKFAQTSGVLVAKSPMAFKFEDWPDGEPAPDIGQRVFIAKHSGALVKGADGKEYRVVKDRDVIGVWEAA